MQQKAHKTIGHVTPQRPMTDEEKQARIMQFLAQKREAFAINILSAVAHGADTDWTHSDIVNAVNLSLAMADALMEKLYPIKEEKPKEGTPAEEERKRMKGNLKEEVCASDVCAYRGKNVCTIKRDEYCPMFKSKEDKK